MLIHISDVNKDSYPFGTWVDEMRSFLGIVSGVGALTGLVEGRLRVWT